MARPALAQEGPAGPTLDVSLLLGATQTRISGFAATPYGGALFSWDELEFGVGLPSVSVGGWLSPRLALGGRISNVWFVPDREEVQNGFVGAELKWLVDPAVVLSGGVGAYLVGDTLDFDNGSDLDVGVGGTLRGSVLPWRQGHDGIGFTAEFLPGIVDEDFAFSFGAGIVWFLNGSTTASP